MTFNGFIKIGRFLIDISPRSCVVGGKYAYWHAFSLIGRLWFINAYFPNGDGLRRTTFLEWLLYRKWPRYTLGEIRDKK